MKFNFKCECLTEMIRTSQVCWFLIMSYETKNEYRVMPSMHDIFLLPYDCL